MVRRGGQNAAVVDARGTGGHIADGTGIAVGVTAADVDIFQYHILHLASTDGIEQGMAVATHINSVEVAVQLACEI